MLVGINRAIAQQLAVEQHSMVQEKKAPHKSKTIVPRVTEGTSQTVAPQGILSEACGEDGKL